MKKISEFLSEKFPVLVVKFSIYLNRRVFVMLLNGVNPDQTPSCGLRLGHHCSGLSVRIIWISTVIITVT